MEVDLAAGSIVEPLERLDAPEADGDVERVRELRPDAARGAARRAGRERVALEQAYVDSGLREVEGDARAGRASADHDDLGSLHRRAHPIATTAAAKRPRFRALSPRATWIRTRGSGSCA